MAKVNLYNQQGQTAGELVLDDALFNVPASAALVHQAVVTQMANSRVAIAHTKDRGEVKGADKKPWKQKGTGRARHGSRYSPIWRGGGITFGPTNERNFSKKMNKSAKRKALAMVLTDKVANEKFITVDTLNIPEAKTKTVFSILGQLPHANAKTLIVLTPENKSVVLAANNLPRVSTISAKSLNIVDLLSHDRIVISKDAVDVITNTFKRA